MLFNVSLLFFCCYCLNPFKGRERNIKKYRYHCSQFSSIYSIASQTFIDSIIFCSSSAPFYYIQHKETEFIKNCGAFFRGKISSSTILFIYFFLERKEKKKSSLLVYKCQYRDFRKQTLVKRPFFNCLLVKIKFITLFNFGLVDAKVTEKWHLKLK